jgi:hypothetical protein
MVHLPSAVDRLQPFTCPTVDEEKMEIVMVFVESQICELLYSIKK